MTDAAENDHPTDARAEVVRRATEGDPEAIDALLARHFGSLLGYLRLRADPLLREHESCTDIAQSVCREVLEDVGQFEYRGEGPFRAWLFSRALGKLINRKRYYLEQCRDVSRVQPLASDVTGIGGLYARIASPSEHAIGRETVERFEAAFDRLPEAYRDVILSAKLLGLSHAEIGQKTGRAAPAVRVQLHRALARLGVLLRSSRVNDDDG